MSESASGIAFDAWTCDYGDMFFLSADATKVQLLRAIVGTSIGCGMFLMLAIINLLENKVLSLVLMLVLAGLTLVVAVEGCKKIAKLIP